MAVTAAITKKKAAISPSPVMIDTTVVSHGQGKPANIDSRVRWACGAWVVDHRVSLSSTRS